jgi:hypothetical protein
MKPIRSGEFTYEHCYGNGTPDRKIMKTRRNLIQIWLLCAALFTALIAKGQGTFVYDQSSVTNPAAGGDGAPIKEDKPMGQSFTPTQSSIGFVQLNFIDVHPGNSLGATVYVNLWSGSISNGTLLSSTDPIFMPDGASHLVTNFLFSAPVTLTPGTTYYLQPFVVQSGSDDPWDVVASLNFNYSGGTAYFNGAPDINNHDLWFREGVLDVPEPGVLGLFGLGGLCFLWHRRKSA